MNRMSSAEFVMWKSYYQNNPFGEERGDIRCGIVASTIANVNRKKSAKPFKIQDFMPKFEKPKQQSVEEMQARFRMAANIEKHNKEKAQ